jgi:hypothetical protein
MKFTEATKFHRKSGGEPRPALRSAIDREYTELTQLETAEPEESSGGSRLTVLTVHFLAISRTRISCHDALERTACALFREERRMKFTEATKFHRKSRGEPQPDRECQYKKNQDRFRPFHGDNTGSNPVGDLPSRDGEG